MSPATKPVLLLLKELNLAYEFRVIRVKRGQNLTAEYMKKNPAHTLPTLEDEGRYIGDSHAIMAYLVGKYAKNDQLYPKDLYKRAVVDQRLHYENGHMFMMCVRQVFEPLIAKQIKEVPDEKLQAMLDCYATLEAFLQYDDYIAGAHLTIADFSCVISASCMDVFQRIIPKRFPKLYAWMLRMGRLPYFEEVLRDKYSLQVMKSVDQQMSNL